MGGCQFTLTAGGTCRSGRIVYRQEIITENESEPDFSLAWSVIAGTSCSPGRGGR